MSPRRALLLINPGSRRGRDDRQAAETLLAEGGLELVHGDVSDPARYADVIRGKRDSVDLVIVGGGDGSINLALPGVLGGDLPLGILPLGTANNLARNLGIPVDLEAAARIVLAASEQLIDVADVNGSYFLNVSGLGLSTEINRRIPKDLKRRWGILAYVIFAYKVARRMRPFHAEIAYDDEPPRRVRTLQITVCNGRHYGAGMKISAGATIDDGRLELCSTEIDAWWKALRLIPSMMRGTPERQDALRWLSATRVEIRTRRSLRVDADGELVTRTPVVYRIHPRRLRIFAPTAP